MNAARLAAFVFLACVARAEAPAKAEPSAGLGLEEPSPAPTVIVTEREESPRFYRVAHPLTAGMLRAGPSLGLRFPGNDDSFGTFVLGYDATVGARLPLGRADGTLAFWPEAGYAFVGSNGHLAHAGPGLALQRALARDGAALSYGLVPRAVYGTMRDERAFGGRLDLVFENASPSLLGVIEVSYLYLVRDGGDLSELRLGWSFGLYFLEK